MAAPATRSKWVDCENREFASITLQGVGLMGEGSALFVTQDRERTLTENAKRRQEAHTERETDGERHRDYGDPGVEGPAQVKHPFERYQREERRQPETDEPRGRSDHRVLRRKRSGDHRPSRTEGFQDDGLIQPPVPSGRKRR